MPGQSGPGSNGNEGVLRIPQSHSINGISPDSLVSYPGHSLGAVLPFCREKEELLCGNENVNFVYLSFFFFGGGVG